LGWVAGAWAMLSGCRPRAFRYSPPSTVEGVSPLRLEKTYATSFSARKVQTKPRCWAFAS